MQLLWLARIEPTAPYNNLYLLHKYWRDVTYSHNSSLKEPQHMTELEVAKKIDRVKMTTNCPTQVQKNITAPIHKK